MLQAGQVSRAARKRTRWKWGSRSRGGWGTRDKAPPSETRLVCGAEPERMPWKKTLVMFLTPGKHTDTDAKMSRATDHQAWGRKKKGAEHAVRSLTRNAS